MQIDWKQTGECVSPHYPGSKCISHLQNLLSQSNRTCPLDNVNSSALLFVLQGCCLQCMGVKVMHTWQRGGSWVLGGDVDSVIPRASSLWIFRAYAYTSKEFGVTGVDHWVKLSGLLTCLLPEIDSGVLPWVRFWPVSVHEVRCWPMEGCLADLCQQQTSEKYCGILVFVSCRCLSLLQCPG